MRSTRVLFYLSFLILLNVSCSTENTPVYQLTTSSNPTEGGTVSPAQGEYDEGDQVTITASPNENWVFDSWQGDHTGSQNPASVTMDSDKTITALFSKREYPLTLNIEGEGTVDEQIVQQKSTDYPHGTVVELTANPADGWEFVEWQGGLSESGNPETITVESEVSVTAIFKPIDYLLTIETEGNGAVEEEIIQSKATEYAFGTEVQLTAVPDVGWSFIEWQGDLSGIENPQSIVIESETKGTAVFEEDEYTVDISTDGQGSITISPEKDAYNYGDEIDIEVNPGEGWNFVHWDGSLEGTENPISFTIDSNISATAILDQSPFAGGNGSEMYPYLISDVEQLQKISNYTNKHFILNDNIDASDTKNWNSGNGFEPIGDYEFFHFEGSIDGMGYSITDLYIDRPNLEYVGLIAYSENASIQNLNIENLNVNGGEITGGLIGYARSTSLSDINIRGKVQTSQTINVVVGGIVGLLSNSTMDKSQSSGIVNSESRSGGLVGEATRSIISDSNSNSKVYGSIQAGGLIGTIRNNSKVVDSYSSGNVTSDRNINSGRTGGLTAQNWDSEIINSYANGDVTGSSYMVGGFVGNNRGDIISSYSTGDVTGTNDMVGGLVGRNSEDSRIVDSYSLGSVVGDNQVGGLVGLNRDNALIKRSYSVGNVEGKNDIGGLIGLNASDSEFSYWDKVNSNQSSGVGEGFADGVTGLNTSQMQGSAAQDNMPEFDWEDVWKTVEGDYPILQWQDE